MIRSFLNNWRRAARITISAQNSNHRWLIFKFYKQIRSRKLGLNMLRDKKKDCVMLDFVTFILGFAYVRSERFGAKRNISQRVGAFWSKV